MAERRISMLVDLDLSRGSKEAYHPTIERLATEVGRYATELFEENGYNVRRSMTTTTMHYVRHVIVTSIKRPRVLKAVRTATKAVGQ